MSKQSNPYSPHPSISYAISGMRNIERESGKTIDEWVKLINSKGPEGAKERQAWLKKEHGFGTNQASWLTECSFGHGMEFLDEESYLRSALQSVEEMYSGKKAALRPLYDTLLKKILALKLDVKFCPGKTIVPIYREHVIAQIKPTTNTRIDFGLALGDHKAEGRLIDTGGFAKKDRITHRIEIKQDSDIDDELFHWFKLAYERDSP